MNIRNSAVTRKTVEAGASVWGRHVPHAVPAGRDRGGEGLTLALQCGGSTAIPASPPIRRWERRPDLLVRHGVTAVLGRDAGDLWAPAPCFDPPRGQPGGFRREADRPDQVVGGVHRPQWRRDETTSPSRGKQAGGLTHDPWRSRWARGQGRGNTSGGCLQICRADHRKRLYVSWTRGGTTLARPGQVAGGCNIVCFTTGRGVRVGVQAGALAEAGHQPRRCTTTWPRTWTSTAAKSWTAGCRSKRWAGASSRRCWRRPRARRLAARPRAFWRQRVHPLA